MNRRHFLTTVGGAAAAAGTLTHVNTALAAQTSAFYVKGLVMASFEDPKVLRLGLPKAPGHKATLQLTPQRGSEQWTNLKGIYSVESSQSLSVKPNYKIPELVRLQEIYGNDVHSRVQDCPTVIHISYAAIRLITATEISPTRYTFVRADNGQEITTFRPRKIAETLKIELSPDSVLRLNGAKNAISLNTMKEVHAEYAPEDPAAISGIDAFTAHFPHYNAYLDRSTKANFDVLPRNLGPMPQATPKIGNNFAGPLWPYYACYVVGL
jgi:hypothetical protein